MTEKYDFTEFSFDSLPCELLPKRRERSSKGDYGRLLCVCGSSGMSGAAYLCAKSAYRTGAGLVEVFTPEENRVIIQSTLPEAIVTAYNESNAQELLLSSLARASAVVAGCGLSTSHLSQKLIATLLRNIDTAKTPLVLDADALNVISKHKALKKYTKGAIITPHALEFSRLTGYSVEDILTSPKELTYAYAKENSLICVLKDHESIVSDGSTRIYINKSGNDGMATAGSGDVLAGIIAGLLAQSRRADLEIAALGVYVHGLCGDLGAKRLSKYSLMASDIIDSLPEVLKKI